MSQFTFFNYVAGITIGSLAATISLNTKMNALLGLSAILAWTILTILVDYINFKFKTARKIIDGQPEIVIREGKVMEKALSRLRLDMDELNLMLRNRKVFSIKEVDYAIMETNGRLSVLSKEEFQPVTKQDMHIKKQVKKFVTIPTEIILKGQVMTRNLQNLRLDKSWLDNQLKQANAELADVYYAEIQPDGSLYIDRRTDRDLT